MAVHQKMQMSPFESAYVALEKSFPDVGSSFGVQLFRLRTGGGRYGVCNACALEMNYKPLMELCGSLRPTSYKALVIALRAFDERYDYRLSGLQLRRSRLEWVKDEAE